ncbi:hypothetical protein ACFFQW_30735 [Umezawaea endophytica]|uniref:Aminoglycoside phosphotransferase domain-containing protein n=1 Tax=Umezawaea endophytica TaxID=1654476 RepID=A0A9X2VV44_9PSEU|nr:hypothetical protein [Umezawaea endophytica]MCS7482907.1 hypothetical protein [Umezawaea endophytica]
MKKYGWSELPDSIRQAVRTHIGDIADVQPTTTGQSCNFSATVRRGSREPVFVKAVVGVSPAMRWLRNEAEAAGLAPGIAPAVLFADDIDDWLIVGFEHLTGRPAKLGPGSTDLPLIASTLARISAVTAPTLRPLTLRWASSWWPRLAEERPDTLGAWNLDLLSHWERQAPERVSGDTLVHSDLHADQFIITDTESVHVIDWGLPAAGAAWVDPALLVIRLIDAGHSPGEAETWARQHTRWADASEDDITAFAVYVAGLWTYKAAATDEIARMARRYADWRLSTTR